MSNTTPSSTSRIARSLAPRHVLPVALLFLIADLALTDALLGLAVEKNPIAAWLFESIGVTTTGVVAVGVVTLAYVGLDALDRYERERRVVSGGLLGVMIAPVVWNLGVWVRLGTPSVALGGVVEMLATVIVSMGVAIGATKVDLDRVPHPDSDTVVSIVLSVLMVTSMVGGAAFVGTQSFSDSEAGGTVSAQEYNSQSLIFSVSSDDSLRAINSSMGSQVWRFDGHTSSLTTVAVTPDKSTVFSGGFDNTIKAVDTTSGEEIWSFNNHRDTVREVSLSGDGSILYSVSDDGTVRGIDAGSGAQLWKYENGGRLISVEPLSSSNSVLYGTAGGTVKRLNIDGMNISWSEGLHSSSSDEVDAIEQSIGGSVYSGAGDGTVKKIDPFSGNITWVYDNIGPVNDISVSNSGIYIAYDGGVKSLNSSGGQIWSYNDYADNVRSISASQVDDVVYTGTGNAGTIKAINTTSVSSIWSFTGHGLGVNAIAAAPPSIQPDPPFPGWEDTAPLIRAVDQNGDPVRNATIEAWSVETESLADEVENKEARAQEIIDELDNVQPDQWTPPTQVDLSYGDLTDLYNDSQPSGVYPTAHTKGDMGIAGWADTHDLIPRLEFESGEKIYLYAWDGSAGANMGPLADGVTSEHYGEIADDPTFNLKRISPTGETLDNHTVESTESETYSGGIPPLSYEHDYATATVPDGYYLVSVQGSDTPGYVIKVGEATDVLTTEMRNEANQLTEQAETLGSYLGEDTLMRDRVTATEELTRESHEYENRPLDLDAFDYGHGYVNPGLQIHGQDINDQKTDRVRDFPNVAGSEIYLQGYRGPDVGIDDFEDQNVTDIMELASNVDEPIYASKKPKRVDMSEIEDPDNATIEVTLQKFDSGLNPDVSEYANETERLKNQLLNQSTAELESLFRDNPELLNGTELEARHEELQDLVESNNDLEERVAELRDSESIDDAANTSEEQLKKDLAAMEQAIAELEGQLEAEPPTSEIDGGEIFAEFPFAESLNPDAITVIANYEDGSSEVIDDEYISVESASVLGGDQVVVDGLEIPSDRAVADLEVKGVSTGGALGTSRDSVTNPAFQGTIPELDAIDMSTLRPGVGDSVGMTPRSSAEGYGGAESATVYGPDGQTLNVTRNDERFRWTPEQTGTHTIRLTYSNTIGGEFTETVRVGVEENPASTPPTVRVTDGIGGNLLLAGDGLESGSISVDGANAKVVAQAPGDNAPSSLDIHAEQLAVDSMDVSVVMGTDQRSVDRHVSLRVWANFGVEDALVLRQPGEPITADEQTPFGAFETRTSESGSEHQVVETYTEADGTTTVQVQRNPSLLDRASYQIAIWGIDLPFTTLSTTPPMSLPLTMTAPPAVDEATAGQIVFGPTDMTTAATGVTA